MTSPKWITEASVLRVHAESLANYGGRQGLRDAGALQSALARAKNLFSYEGVSDLAALAAAYSYGVARNHPFIDGNKRVAFFLIGVFLWKNDYVLIAKPNEATEIMLRVASGETSEAELAEWIRANMRPRA